MGSYVSGKCQGNLNFFQGQGIVREFCDVSGKNEILQKCQEILHFSLMKLGCLVPMYLFCSIHKVFGSNTVREI